MLHRCGERCGMNDVVVADIRGYKVVFEGVDGSKNWSIIQDSSDGVMGHIACHTTCTGEWEEHELHEDYTPSKVEEKGIMCWFSNEKDAICYYCGATVPAEIQALIHLSCSF